MASQFGIGSSSSHSTTQLNDQPLRINNRAYSNTFNDNYNDLTLNLMSTLSNKHKSDSQGLGRDYWLDDSSATKCRSCDRNFTTFRRKHHCRICGKIFCNNCTTFINGEKFNHSGKMRVCLLCLKLADRFEEYASSEDDSVIEDTNSSFHNMETVSPSRLEAEPSITNGNTNDLQSTSSNLETSIGPGSAPMPPPMMAIATTRKGEAVEIDIPRSNSVSRKSRTSTIMGSRPFHLSNNGNSSGLGHNGDSAFGKSSNGNGHVHTDLESKKIPAPLNFTTAAANAAADAASSIFNFGTAILPGNSQQNGHHSSSTANSGAYDTNSQPYRNTSFRINPRSGNNVSDLLESHRKTAKDDHNLDPVEYPGTLSGSHTLLSATSDNSDESEDEQAMLAFTSLHANPEGSQEFNWTHRNPSTGLFKLDDSSVMFNSRRNFRSGRSKRAANFHRLKNRRMSKSGTRLFSDSSLNNPFTSKPSTSNFGFGSDDFEFLDDFLRAGESHARNLLTQLLADRKVEQQELWVRVLIKCLKRISSVSMDMTNGESFDISSYLKLKKIPGSSISDTTIVDGLVFSKGLPLRSMPTQISTPRIMLVTFQIEYEQESDSKFSSIEPIIAQQDQFLEKLVARIVALKPNIVLTDSSVNGYALKLLADAGIAVASNVKSQVMQRLAKLTKADIINSIDRLAMSPMLGKCGKFEVKTYLHENVKRTYFFFTGCNPELGYTVLLRGGSKEELDKIKECANLMTYVFFNVKLESGLMRDQCLQAGEYTTEIQTRPLDSTSLGSYDDVWDLFDVRILSSSPWVHFKIPFALSKLKTYQNELEENRILYGKITELYDQIKNGNTGNQETNVLFDSIVEYSQKWKIKYTVDDLPQRYDDLMKIITCNKVFLDSYFTSEIGLSERQWDQFWSSRKFVFFDPSYHQNIVTLYSMVSTKNATPCIGPEIQLTDYYWENDFCLGQYIEHICLHANDLCVEGCGLTLREHFRSYVHGNGKVDVVVENNSRFFQGKEDIIMSWSYCKICQNMTPVLPLSDNAWKYSFGKYLELSFWCRGMKVKGATCPHDFYGDQIHYFGFQNLTVRVEYSEVEVLELIPPKFQLFWKPEYDIQIKVDTYTQVLNKSNTFFDSVRSRLNRVKVDSMTVDKMEAGQKRIEELKKRVEEEHESILKLAEGLYRNASVSEHLKLTAVIREVQELSSDWNYEFQEFDKKFLPTEKEIKKITAFQLDRLFRASNESKPVDIDSIAAKDVEKEIAEKVDSYEPEKDLEISGHHEHNAELSEDEAVESSFENKSPNSRRRGQLVLEKIHELQMMGGLSEGSSSAMSPTRQSFPVTDPSGERKWLWDSRGQELQTHILESQDQVLPKLSGLTNDGKVKKLTEFFDAQEFFRQREQEKRKLQENSYRPKLAASKPTVEVYKNVQDAVEAEQSYVRKKESMLQRQETTHKPSNRELTETNDEGKAVDVTKGTAPAHEAPVQTTFEEQEPDWKKQNVVKPEISQPEKSSLLKSLTHFWADRSATLWEPLSYPLNSTEHIFVDSDVIVREDEPSSIIAFCLNTSDYGSKLYNQEKQQQQQQQQQQKEEDQEVEKEKNTLQVQDATSTHPLNNVEGSNEPEEAHSSMTSSRIEGDYKEGETSMENSNVYEDFNFSLAALDLEQVMLKKGFHLKYQFEEGYSTISCKIFFAEQFDAFRRQCGVNGKFIESLSRCVKWDSTGGKSGSAFLKTLDNRFIIKELSRVELEAFVQFAPSYFEYFAQALFHNLPTVLVKIFGFYQIQVKNNLPGAKSYTINVLIMENLFYDRKMSRIFDLKGSMRNRHVEQTGKENEVLLDENMVEYIYESPLFVRENAKRLLRVSLWNDTLFLAKMNVMDYSLMVGIDSENNELVVGIIDCIRTFTWDKKLESWVKEKGLVGGTGVGKEPTVITPKQYKNRFREAMERYILMAPGPFYLGS